MCDKCGCSLDRIAQGYILIKKETILILHDVITHYTYNVSHYCIAYATFIDFIKVGSTIDFNDWNISEIEKKTLSLFGHQIRNFFLLALESAMEKRQYLNK